MADQERFDFWTKVLCNCEGLENHPYLIRKRQERREQQNATLVTAPAEEPKVDKGYRKILLVGFDNRAGEMMGILENAFEGSDVSMLDYVITKSEEEARYLLTDPNKSERFDYIIMPGIARDAHEKVKVKCISKYGMKTVEEVPKITINGYDLAYVASMKGTTAIIFDECVDENRAKHVGAIPVRSGLENELIDHEEKYKHIFQVPEKENQDFQKRLWQERGPRKGIVRRERSAERVCVYI